jgi:hypothetical protein
MRERISARSLTVLAANFARKGPKLLIYAVLDRFCEVEITVLEVVSRAGEWTRTSLLHLCFGIQTPEIPQAHQYLPTAQYPP